MGAPEDRLRDGLAAALRELSADRLDNATELSRALLRASPNDSGVHLLAATVAFRRGCYPEAEHWARSSLALRSGHAPAMLIAGRAALALGNLAQARDWFSQAREAAPDRPEPLFLLCVAQLESGDPEAQVSLAHIMRRFPDDPQGWSQIGAALRKAGQSEAAALAFGRAFAASNDARDGVCHASLLMKLGRVKEAVGVFRAALVIAPESLEVILPLARGLRQLGEFQEAFALLERSAVQFPDDWQVHFVLGLVCEDLHDRVSAIAAYRRCIALRPDLPEARVNLGIALQQEGDLKEATDCYRAAMKIRPDTFGRISQALPSTSRGELWLDLGKLRRSLGG